MKFQQIRNINKFLQDPKVFYKMNNLLIAQSNIFYKDLLN